MRTRIVGLRFVSGCFNLKKKHKIIIHVLLMYFLFVNKILIYAKYFFKHQNNIFD